MPSYSELIQTDAFSGTKVFYPSLATRVHVLAEDDLRLRIDDSFRPKEGASKALRLTSSLVF